MIPERTRNTIVSQQQIGPCPTIRTARLLLRPHNRRDADAIADALSDFCISRMLAHIPAPYHRQDAIDWLAATERSRLPQWNLAVCDTDGRHIGAVSIELRHGAWQLGYWLNRTAWGRGLMTEAAGAALKAFFEEAPGAQVLSGMFSDNPASLRVQQKLGFTITGCRDVFARARNCMVIHVDTHITAQDLVYQ